MIRKLKTEKIKEEEKKSQRERENEKNIEIEMSLIKKSLKSNDKNEL